MFRFLLFPAKILLTVLSALVLFILSFYCQTTLYSYPDTERFSGPAFYNPYQQIPGTALTANFHAHTSAYGGATNGDNSLEEMKDCYSRRGIDVAAISNYFQATPGEDLRVYEHGINLSKTHKLAINPAGELYFDYAVYQNTSQKQDIISRLRKKDALVVVAHPNMRNGHTLEDMTHLVEYHFTEIRSYYAYAEKYWDAALQSGKLSWLMVNDDSHGVQKQLPGRFYNVVFTSSKDSLLPAMLAGRHYGIAQKTDTTDLKLHYMTLKNDSLCFNLGGNATVTRLIADGQITDSLAGGAGRFHFPAGASYVRLVAESPHCHLYTNPVIRSSEAGSFEPVASLSPTIRIWPTLAIRLLFMTLFALLLTATLSLWLKLNLPTRNRTVRVPDLRTYFGFSGSRRP